MTAKEALQALVDQTLENMRYSPINLVNAIALLDKMEQREKEAQYWKENDHVGELFRYLDDSLEVNDMDDEETGNEEEAPD